MGRWKLILLVILALSVVGSAGYVGYFGLPTGAPAHAEAEETPPATVPVTKGNVRQIISAPGRVNGTHEQDLTMGVEGRVDSVTVRPGDAVTKGQVLVQLGEKNRFEAAVSAARLDLLQARQDLEDLRASAPQAAADAQADLIEAEDAYNKAQTKVEALKYPRATQARIDSTYNDYQKALQQVAVAQDHFRSQSNLAPDDPRYVEALQALTSLTKEKDRLLGVYNWITAKPTEQEIAETQAAMEVAKATYDSAKRAWERLKDGPDAMELELAQASIADKERLLAQAEEDLAHLTLTAPFDGVVTDVQGKVGAEVSANTAVVTLSNPGALEAEVTVVEEDYALMQPGMPAQLYFDAQPDAQVTGHVSRVVPSRTSDSTPMYPVFIEIDEVPAGLAPGMTVDASIITAEKKDVLILPKALVRARTDGTATVEVWANGSQQSREITIGLIGDSDVEIVSGLAEGELVVGR